jgi:hypothetical protein
VFGINKFYWALWESPGDKEKKGCSAGEVRRTPHIFPYVTVIPNESFIVVSF